MVDQKCCAKAWPRDLVVFDVGANAGSYSKAVLDSGASIRRVFAFEPNPATFEILKTNHQLEPKMRFVQAALSDSAGDMLLFDRVGESHGGEHASLSEDVFFAVHNTRTKQVSVKVDTVDQFCKANDIGFIDFMKIDVEGFKLNVLNGAKESLSNRRIKVIQFEFTQLNSTVGVFFKQFFDLLNADYHIYRLLPHGLHEIRAYSATRCEIFGYQNCVAILKAERTL